MFNWVTQRFYPLNRNRGKRQSQSRCTQWVERFFRFFIFKYHPCTQIVWCLFSLFSYHIDASMQKCLDLKRSLTTASERYMYHQKPTLVNYIIRKITPITNIATKKKKNSGQEWPIKFFGSRWFYQVGRVRGNKQYFIFGLTLTSFSWFIGQCVDFLVNVKFMWQL